MISMTKATIKAMTGTETLIIETKPSYVARALLMSLAGVKIVGYANTPALLPADASALFSRNLYNFLSAFWDKEQGRPVLDEEIGNAIRLTQGGQVVHERLKG